MSKSNIVLQKNVRNVVATSVIAAAFAFGTGPAYADNVDQEVESQVEETVQLAETEDPSTDELLTEEGDASEVSDETTEDTYEVVTEDPIQVVEEDLVVEAPALLPGDFFYFTKELVENVKLAITFNEVKEAELLASFVEERIKEAAVLLDQGQEDLAKEVLQKAIDQQELALAKYETEETIEEEPTEETTEEADHDGEEVAPVEGDIEEEEVSVDPTRAELEAKFSANIVALQAALDKVENPRAKEALQKNIKKAQEKLEKKINKELAKIKEKNLEVDETNAEVEEDSLEELAERNEEVAEENEEKIEEINEESDQAVEDVVEVEEQDNQEDSEDEKEVEKEEEEESKVEPNRGNQGKERAQEARQKAAEKREEASQKATEKQEKAVEKKEEKANKAAEKAQERKPEDKGKGKEDK